MQPIRGLNVLRLDRRGRRFTLASWHSPHSLTWRWLPTENGTLSRSERRRHAAMGGDEYAEGRLAYTDGKPVDANPYPLQGTKALLWSAGWLDAKDNDPLEDHEDE